VDEKLVNAAYTAQSTVAMRESLGRRSSLKNRISAFSVLSARQSPQNKPRRPRS
jgi:hypothetical protein